VNIIEAIDYCVRGLPDSGYHSGNPLNTAVKDVKALVAAYEALAPDWADAPDWAQWYEIDDDGDAWWRCHDKSKYVALCSLPLGIDGRLCKWQRP